jgi:hypothetical protein
MKSPHAKLGPNCETLPLAPTELIMNHTPAHSLSPSCTLSAHTLNTRGNSYNTQESEIS